MVCNNLFLNNFEIKEKPKVLLYDLENGSNILHRRINYLIKNKNMESSNFKNFHLEYDFDKNNIERELELAKNYDVIILDSYRRFLKGNESDSEITNDFYNEFLLKLRALNKTVIILHHFKKAKIEELNEDDLLDLFRGSSDIPAQFDIMYGLFKTKEITRMEDKTTSFNILVAKVKNRMGLPIQNFMFNVLKNDREKVTNFNFKGFNISFNNKDNIRDRILKIIDECDNGVEKKEIDKIIVNEYNLSVSHISKILTEMVREGVISRPTKGLYKNF